MKEKILTQINKNITLLNNLIIIKNQSDEWQRQQLIMKYEAYRNRLIHNENIEVDMFIQVMEDHKQEFDELIAKYS